jgi:hypothetical protein
MPFFPIGRTFDFDATLPVEKKWGLNQQVILGRHQAVGTNPNRPHIHGFQKIKQDRVTPFV